MAKKPVNLYYKMPQTFEEKDSSSIGFIAGFAIVFGLLVYASPWLFGMWVIISLMHYFGI